MLVLVGEIGGIGSASDEEQPAKKCRGPMLSSQHGVLDSQNSQK